MKLEDGYEWRKRKNLEGGGPGLFEGIVQVFIRKDREKA
jgi:hypothetical protein